LGGGVGVVAGSVIGYLLANEENKKRRQH